MNDSRETRLTKAFVVGFPIKHSRSPMIHNFWISKLELNGIYEAVEASPDDFPSFLASLKDGSSGYAGGNVTIPHKEAAARLADVPDDLVEELGAANTLWMENGELHATNTDGLGFLANLDEQAKGWDRAQRAVVLGAGGASRSVIQALKRRGIGEIHVVNRTADRARELADRFGSNVYAHGLEALEEVMTGSGLFVNTTSLGMDGAPVPELPFDKLDGNAIVTDIVYVPLVTPVLEQARRCGLKTVDGLGMLLHQAVPGFERWFGRRPSVTRELRDLVLADMADHR
ncbi:shikimate dehydrogenase [Pseudomonas sp. R2.Fl]|nr:shikimate dehydrogenase [Pseudomonas sp. R2.Fl]